MKILVAKTAGFCMGVKRAVDLAVDSSSESGETIYTLGPLIHNDQTLEMLKSRGIKSLTEESALSQNSRLLIRAHGIPPEMEESYYSKGHVIIDGTCPKVKTVHRVIQKYRNLGFSIIIAGDEGHAEVVGLMGYAGEDGLLIQTPEDVDGLPDLEKVCLVSQTTFDRITFDEISDKIRSRYCKSEVIIKKTICSATNKRQEETRELAGKAEAMIVVGGKNSANTLRLAKISRQYASNTQHVETEKEIEWEPISHCKTIGVTAGASTPNWMIKRVLDHLHFLDQTQRRTFKNVILRIFDVISNLNIFIAAGSVAMYYTSCLLQSYPFSKTGAYLSFLYFLSMYLWNSLTNIDLTRHLGISRYRFYNACKSYLFILAFVCIGLILWISYTSRSILLFYLMLISTFAGSAYHFTFVPRPMKKWIRYSKLKDIPTSRDLFVAIAWGVLITFIPHAIKGSFIIKPDTVLFFMWMFILAYLRSLLFDLRDIEGDRIMGRETLVTIIGENRVRRVIIVSLTLSLIFLTSLSVFSIISIHMLPDSHAIGFLFQIPVIFYIWSFIKWSHKINLNRTALFNLLADGQFFVAAASAFAASLLINY